MPKPEVRRRVLVVAAYCFLHATVGFGQTGWTQKFPDHAPSGRNFHAMVYDLVRNEVVLFGGIVNNSHVLGDTWIWNGSTWLERLTPVSPPPRFGHAMAYDAARHEVVLFGGLSASGTAISGDETWVWNGAAWTQMFPATRPPARDLAAMTYDSARDETVLFGGRDLLTGSVLDDTWVWNGNDWMQKFPATHPSARLEHAVAFDASRAEVLLFGGRLAPFPSDMADTWVWNGVNWTERFPATSPPPTGGHALVYDVARGQSIMFGGYDNGAFSRNDTWSWNGTDWTQVIVATAPPARTQHAMAYDSTRRQVVLFGGGGFPGADTGNFDDTWVFEEALPVPRTSDDCKRGGWSDLVRANGTPFKNQGACVSYVNTGR